MSAEHFDAVVIGSGFGGSVMTYRLAEAGLRVCLLERGQAYPPNSFARAPNEMRNNFWDPSKGLYGMYNLWVFKGSGALVSSGLGGGSLIYANVLIRKDPKWFIQEDLQKGGYEHWPVLYKDLEWHYGEVERMMNVQQYPLTHEPYASTPKTLAWQEAAHKRNLPWMPLNLAVSFRQRPVLDPQNPDPDGSNPPLVGAPVLEAHENYHKMTRYTCRLCGECDIGCNYGSKNTLDYTYISAAQRQTPHPADIRPLCEVKSFEPRREGEGRGYIVRYVKHDPERAAEQQGRKGERPAPELQTITCNCLILSAGTFGTPFLLFKNRDAFPLIDKKLLGTRFSVNGDLLSFIVDSHEMKNGKRVPRLLDPSFGPVITGAIRVGDALDGPPNEGRGFYVEDGGHPYLLSWFVELQGLPSFAYRLFHFLKIRLKYYWGVGRDTDLGAEIAELIGDCATSKSSIPVLSMGRDIPNGRLTFEDERLDCDWTIKKSQGYYDRVIATVRGMAKALDARYMDNPSYAWNFHQVLTAHPLGGCPMGREKEGVVDASGEVFNYPGLFIADGSVMPGPVGPNPSLTIAALADLFAERVIARCKGA